MIPIFLLLLLSLHGCASAPKEADIRADFQALPGASFHAKIFSDTGSLALEYELDYVYNKNDSDSLTITAPEALSGIHATIAGKQKSEMTLQYENTVLEAPGVSTPGLTPSDCIPGLLYELRSSVPTETSGEKANGVALTMLKYENAAQENGICRQIWVRQDNGTPVCAEVYVDGQQILRCIFSDWKTLSAGPASQ